MAHTFLTFIFTTIEHHKENEPDKISKKLNLRKEFFCPSNIVKFKTSFNSFFPFNLPNLQRDDKKFAHVPTLLKTVLLELYKELGCDKEV